MKYFLTISILFIFSTSVSAQQSDTIVLKDSIQQHSPTKATILSMALPGLGQAYNKKYWKIPLAWAAVAVPLYFALDERSKFEEFKSAYVKRVDDDPTTIDEKYTGVYRDSQLLSLIDFHRKNRDLMFVLTGVGYALNILDAAVDAHLFHFDVSDELAAHIRPSFQYNAPQQLMVPSLTLSLKFTKKPRQHAY